MKIGRSSSPVKSWSSATYSAHFSLNVCRAVCQNALDKERLCPECCEVTITSSSRAAPLSRWSQPCKW